MHLPVDVAKSREVPDTSRTNRAQLPPISPDQASCSTASKMTSNSQQVYIRTCRCAQGSPLQMQKEKVWSGRRQMARWAAVHGTPEALVDAIQGRPP
jgi:hypothetical protein